MWCVVVVFHTFHTVFHTLVGGDGFTTNDYNKRR